MTGPVFGIDLGTSNSTIAMLRGRHAEVVRNNEGSPTTPSAVWTDPRGRIHVGRRARERQHTDPDNTCVDFKPHMGTGRILLPGHAMMAQSLTAEVLRSMRIDVGQRLGTPPATAVITVPVTFDHAARAATRRAAAEAGFDHTPLLPEPIAAAHAHGLHTRHDDTSWLIYDLGITFTAALIRARDGHLSITHHTTAPTLGGATIDRRLVDDHLIPAARRHHPSLSRDDPRWHPAIAVLTTAAEAAKIATSRHETADIDIDLPHDHHHFQFRHTLTRTDVEQATEPLIAHTIALCHELPTPDQTILVGGQTLTPHLRHRLTELNSPLHTDPDPITTTARGAATYAATALPGR